MLLRSLLSPRSSPRVRVEKLKLGNPLETRLKEARKILTLKAPPKQLAITWEYLSYMLELSCTKEATETASQALQHLLNLTGQFLTPEVKSEARKILRSKNASLELKLKVTLPQVMQVLSDDFQHFEEDLQKTVATWCWEYTCESNFLKFLLKVMMCSPECLGQFDFSEVVIVVCNHCLVSTDVLSTQTGYHQLAIQLISKVTTIMWSIHMASPNLFKSLCFLHKLPEGVEIVTRLLNRCERSFYVNILLDLLKTRESEMSEVQQGAGLYLVVAAWDLRLDCFPISDLLLLQSIEAELGESLKPLISELLPALAGLISNKGPELTCEWTYLLSILQIAYRITLPDSALFCQIDSILGEVVRLYQEGKYLGVISPLLAAARSISKKHEAAFADLID